MEWDGGAFRERQRRQDDEQEGGRGCGCVVVCLLFVVLTSFAFLWTAYHLRYAHQFERGRYQIILEAEER
jgi:hypothetical protein